MDCHRSGAAGEMQRTIPARVSQGIGARLRLQVIQSHIAVVRLVENNNATIHEISDVVRSALAFPVDYVATIPIFEPTFETRDAGLSFDAHGDKSNISIPWAAASVAELPTALHDLTSAVRYPRRSFE
jgi:hypothetical protein